MTQEKPVKPPKTVCQLNAQGFFIRTEEAEYDIYADDGSYLIPAGCIDAPPPDSRAGYAAQWRPESGNWKYVEDLRGKTAYRTDSGEVVVIADAGFLPEGLTLTPRPSPWHNWDGKKWMINEEGRIAQLAAAKADKLDEINAAAQEYINRVSGAYCLPDFEMRTWTLQALEAKAWHDDPNAATPNLDTIAAARGIPADVLKQRAYDKAVKFEQLTAAVVGYRQGLQTKIEQVGSLEELQAIVFDFRLPEILKHTNRQEN